MVTNGPRARFDAVCMARAIRSLPVPDSPLMSTVESVPATRIASFFRLTISSVFPIKLSNEKLLLICFLSCSFSLESFLLFSDLLMTSLISSTLNGLVI